MNFPNFTFKVLFSNFDLLTCEFESFTRAQWNFKNHSRRCTCNFHCWHSGLHIFTAQKLRFKYLLQEKWTSDFYSSKGWISNLQHMPSEFQIFTLKSWILNFHNTNRWIQHSSLECKSKIHIKSVKLNISHLETVNFKNSCRASEYVLLTTIAVNLTCSPVEGANLRSVNLDGVKF